MRGDRPLFVLPNTMRLPAAEASQARSDRPTFLFVGNLNYYPNEDAVTFFVEQMIPILRERQDARSIHHHRVMNDWRLAETAAENAYTCLPAKYTPAVLRRHVAAMLRT